MVKTRKFKKALKIYTAWIVIASIVVSMSVISMPVSAQTLPGPTRIGELTTKTLGVNADEFGLGYVESVIIAVEKDSQGDTYLSFKTPLSGVGRDNNVCGWGFTDFKIERFGGIRSNYERIVSPLIAEVPLGIITLFDEGRGQLGLPFPDEIGANTSLIRFKMTGTGYLRFSGTMAITVPTGTVIDESGKEILTSETILTTFNFTLSTPCSYCDGCQNCRSDKPAGGITMTCQHPSGVTCDCYLLGDIDGKGGIVVTDAVQILMFLAKNPTSLVKKEDTKAWRAAKITAGHTDTSSPAVADAVQILMYLAHNPTSRVNGTVYGNT